MRTDEISRSFVSFAEVDKTFYPVALCRGRTTNPKRRVDLFDGFGSVAIELEVIALRASPKRS